MSQKEPVKGTINGVEYLMYPLAPSQSMDLLIDVVSVISPIVAPIIGAAFSGKGSDVDQSVLDKEITPEMFSNAFGKLDAPKLKAVRKQLTEAFAPVTHRAGTPLTNTWEAVFFGDIGEMFQWLAWGCKVQWGKSLSVLGSVLPSQGAKAPQ